MAGLLPIFIAGCVASDANSVLSDAGRQPAISPSQSAAAPEQTGNPGAIPSSPSGATTARIENRELPPPNALQAPETNAPTQLAGVPSASSASPSALSNSYSSTRVNRQSSVANQTPGLGQRSSSFATSNPEFGPFAPPRKKKTYLINGLASNIGAIGYGFTNLSKKIPGSVLHNYASFVESSTVIRARVTRELKAAYRADPNLDINLIGISFGANIVTLIAADLDRSNIPVNYLATLEGPAMVPIRDNVRLADNFSCTNLDCFRTVSRLKRGNRVTDFDTFKIKTSHIPLANHPQVHRRVLNRIASQPTRPNSGGLSVIQ